MSLDQQPRLRDAIGRRAERYLRVFERIASRGGWAPGWNMAAFVHSTAWFCYRRMYGWAALNFLGPYILMALAVAVAVALPEQAAFIALGGFAAYLLLTFVWVPVYADSLYYRRIVRRLADPGTPPRPPSAWTGLAGLALVVAWLPVMAVLLLPSYGDYTPRAKVSEAILAGSHMRTEITEFYQQNGRLPNVEEAAKFREEGAMTSKYVQSVIYDPHARRITITLREPYPGKQIALRAELRGTELHRWACGPIDLDRKHLPSSCRE